MLLLAPHWQARSRRRPVKGHLYRISSIDLARRPAAPPPSSPGRPPVMKLSPAFFFSCAVLVPPALVAAEPGPAVVRHAPAMSGRIEGSLQVLAAESISIREHAAITGDLLVPGRPELRRDRTAKLGGIADGTGAPLPDRHTVSLAERSSVGRLVRQTDAVPLPAVPPPPTPPGNRTVNLRNSRASPGDFATLRHLDLGEDLGLLPIPPGAYGNFSAAEDSGFILGRTGDVVPAIYSFQHLALARKSRLVIAGPVIVTLGAGLVLRGSVGDSSHPSWFDLRLARGGLTLAEDSNVRGRVTAPLGTVLISEDAHFTGQLYTDRLTVEENAVLRLIAPDDSNRPPTVKIETPAAQTVFPARATIPVRADATDPDGPVDKVEILVDGKLTEARSNPPWHFNLRGLESGPHLLIARAHDQQGASADSPAVPILVAGNQPPVVSLVGPAAGATFAAPAQINVRATATDPDGAIAKVEFFLGSLRLADDPQSPYEAAIGPLPPGNYVLTARAFDNHGASTLSLPVPIIVRAANPAPSIALVAPADGAIFTAPAQLVLSANAFDAGGAVARVEFFAGTTKLGEKIAPPFDWLIEGLAAGTYRFNARATDNAGAASQSASVTVLVNQPPIVALTSPLPEAVLAAAVPVTLTAAASDADGTVQRVDFYVGSDFIGTALSPPYRIVSPPLGAGTHRLSARAFDNHGASASSPPVNVSVPAPNLPPSAILVAPADGARFTFPATIPLLAQSTDPEGGAISVEFLHGDLRLGESAAPPFSSTWTVPEPGTYTLTVRAIDAQGAATISAPATITVEPGRPTFTAGFEIAEGYVEGSLDGQQGWSVSGTARIAAGAAPAGERLLVLDAALAPAAARHSLLPADESQPTFLDLRAQPPPTLPQQPTAFLEWAGASLSLVSHGNGFELRALIPRPDGSSEWQALPGALTQSDTSSPPWLRLTLRKDTAAGYWDVYVDGRLVACDLELVVPSATESAALILSAADGAARFDAVAAGSDHPLFADADGDGMDDAWESAHGLNPSVNDRYDDRDADGLSNVNEYMHGLRPDRGSTFADGIPDDVRLSSGLGLAGPVADTTPPSPPEQVGIYLADSGHLVIWSEATDNVGVSHYALFRNDQPLAERITSGFFHDLGASHASEFVYRIQAVDFAGNRSALSLPATSPAPERDSDGRGLPDEWQLEHFGTIGTDPSADTDLDGKTNLQEFRDGTDPHDFYNGVSPIHEPLYGGGPGPEDQLAMVVRKPGGAPWPGAPVTFSVTQGNRHLAATRSATTYRRTITVRADAAGLAQAFLEPVTP